MGKKTIEKNLSVNERYQQFSERMKIDRRSGHLNIGRASYTFVCMPEIVFISQ